VSKNGQARIIKQRTATKETVKRKIKKTERKCNTWKRKHTRTKTKRVSKIKRKNKRKQQ
jgi:hypothetical protein